MNYSLNPYYTGSYSISKMSREERVNEHDVLILIILEVTL